MSNTSQPDVLRGGMSEHRLMRFLVVEHFRNGDAGPVYARFRAKGRLAPAGVTYVDSWVTEDLRQCFQLMECESRQQLDEWIANWSDLVDFDVFPVITSAEAAARVPREGDTAS